MSRIDTEAIRDALPIADYARVLGIELRRSGKELRGTCPVCDGASRRPFCVLGAVFKCHVCGESGDVIRLCQLTESLRFPDAARRCAELSGLDPNGPSDDRAVQDRERRISARKAREAERARIAAKEREAAEASARRFWQSLARSSKAGLAYLRKRGVESVAGDVRFTNHHVCLPLRQLDGTLTNVVRRRLDAREPKILGHTGCGTLGAFGHPDQLEQTTGPVLIVEGLFDWLSARILAPERLILGAHGAGRLADVTRMVAARCTERGLVFVPHKDKAGERFIKAAIKAARDLGVSDDKLRRFDVGQGRNDLNDYLCDGGQPGALDAAPTLAELASRRCFPLTDAGNAARFAHLHHRRFRYIMDMGKWFRWDGKSWDFAYERVHLIRAAIATTRRIERDAAIVEPSDRDMADALRDHARRSQSDPRLTAMVRLACAMPELVTEIDQLDRDPFLLTCDNGTLDLRTGKLRPHRREDLITSRSSVAYDPDAPCPRWRRFLAEIFEPNPDAAVFVQRFAGYSLTSDTSAQCLLFAHGGGANGKGVFFHTIAKLLGGLATTVPFDTFVHRRNGEIPGHTLASMFGKRVVMAPEGNKGDRLAEGLIKQVTGGDAITARFMYKDPFNYQPAFKLWMSSNHEPEIRGNDDGIWRRFKLVPFEVSFEGRRDDHLEDALDAELPGILAWAVRGCLDWQRDGGGLRGLGESASVTEATASYRSESDVIGSFIEDCCVVLPEAGIRSTGLYDAYKGWAERRGFRSMNCRTFGQEIKRRGFRLSKSNGQRWYRGLGLLADSE